jgi:hypothetical protein
VSAVLEAGLNEFFTVFENETAAFGVRTRAANGGKEDGGWWRKNGATMVQAYYNWRIQNPNLRVWQPNGVPAIELEVSVNLPGDVFVKGFIDRVFEDAQTGDLVIVDLKTGKTTPPPIQLAFYRLMLLETLGVDAKWGAYWMGRTGVLGAPISLDQYPPQMVARWIRDTKKAIDLGIFVPHVGRDCSWCGVREHCYTQGNRTYMPDFNSDLIATSQERAAL